MGGLPCSSGIDDTLALSQPFRCAGPDLGDSLLKANLTQNRLPRYSQPCAHWPSFHMLYAQCDCWKDVDYTNHIIHNVLLNRVYDSDICHELLDTPDVLTKPINKVVALAKDKEMAQNAFLSHSVSATMPWEPTTSLKSPHSSITSSPKAAGDGPNREITLGHPSPYPSID